ncbi:MULTISPECIES: hypothetical protein [Prochlorococcus]|uniref:hypothetical protein n=1 Tax=Prochlorococcus TaxID=1218 RepID=UPI000533B65F|nr:MULTISPECIES: hypothetical protein [Prochlorococcus]KGG14150.1 hypothetical protein EV05_0039 [Prochlorococcus sp. MIT 0601]
MNKILLIFFALALSAGPALSWGWGGEGGECPYSKDQSNQEKTEQVKESDD